MLLWKVHVWAYFVHKANGLKVKECEETINFQSENAKGKKRKTKKRWNKENLISYGKPNNPESLHHTELDLFCNYKRK